MTVSQWHTFSSCRTLPGNANCCSVLDRVVGQHLGIDGELARALQHEVAGERRNVLEALAQRRQAQPDDVEPVQQVLAEQSLPHALLEVLVRRGDHAHVRLERGVPADAVVLAVREHAQQPDLQVRRHVADLVEEQRAALGLLEAAAPRALRAGERAALVPEQLALEQVLRDRRRVDRDERTRGARAVTVQRARDELLAGPRFAGDQHGRVRLRQPPDRPEHLLHRRRLAEDFRRLRAGRLDRRHDRRLAGRAANERDRVVDVERLGQVLERAALERLHGAVEVRVRGHHDDRDVRKALLDLGEQRDARLARHPDVGDEHLRLAHRERLQHLVRRAERLVGDALARERLLEHPADRAVVVDDPHGADRFAAARRLVVVGMHACVPSWIRPARAAGRAAGRS
jgi:hypothetical protein